MFIGCASRPAGDYVIDNQGHWRKLSDKEALIATFKSKVHMTAYYEKRGHRPINPKYSWHEYWTKVVPYWIGSQEYGTHEEIMTYIAQKRRSKDFRPYE